MSVLNCASDRLAISSSLSCIFFWSFDLFFYLGHFFLSWCTCYFKVRSLRCSPGWGNTGHCTVTLYWGRVWEGAMALAPLSAGFQSLPPPPTIKLGPFGADSRVGGLVHALGPCGSLQWTLLWGWESPAAVSTPTGVFNQRFEALFFHAGVLGCVVCLTSLPFLPVYLCANVGPQGLPATTLWGLLPAAWPAPFHNPPPHWVRQPPPCCESSPPRLPISAPPTGLDECFFFISLVVGLPYSLIFCQFWLVLFLNCCCPSFGCARRHSVSTYTSILAGSLQ